MYPSMKNTKTTTTTLGSVAIQNFACPEHDGGVAP